MKFELLRYRFKKALYTLDALDKRAEKDGLKAVDLIKTGHAVETWIPIYSAVSDSKARFFETQVAIRDEVLSLFEIDSHHEDIKKYLDVMIGNANNRQKALKRRLTQKEVKDWYGLHVTTDHNDKMSGMMSISTTCLFNDFCRRYMEIKGAICQKCFSATQQKHEKSMQKPLLFNAILLQTVVIPVNLLPMINALYFRFESFGDLGNETQYINYMNIAKANRKTRFALWTKNPFIIARALESGYKKPSNCKHILSSLFVNTCYTWDYIIKKGWNFIDRVFTVYENEEAAAQAGQKINCGARHCLSCRRCYEGNEKNINELLK